ncbi:MAG: hypothetical protein PHG79_11975 [Methanosarcina sp.]|nr:hypothetical protein [Methanosarcina sp.]MDD4522584.1 hypothetical protein [Methanosarcina sp.]
MIGVLVDSTLPEQPKGDSLGMVVKTLYPGAEFEYFLSNPKVTLLAWGYG